MKSSLTFTAVLVVAFVSVVLAQAPAPIVIDKLPFVVDKPGTYVLKEDLSCPDSGIFIMSGDATIDLGGHTLTYGAGSREQKDVITYNSLKSGNVGHHAIYVTSDPRNSKDSPVPAQWNTRFKGVVIKNGTVRDGQGGISYSDAIAVSGTSGCEIAGLTIEMSAPDSSAIVAGPQSRVHDCRIVHKGTVVSNRHAQLAVIVCGQGTEVFNVTILGGPQIGVKAANDCNIHHNEIRHNATATNCYGVTCYGQSNVQIHHNKIIPKNGRGIHLSEKSSKLDVHDNYVEVRETANKEYPKEMQTHGIKMEGTRDSKVYGNVVLSVSVPGGSPTPLNFDVAKDSNNEVWNNVFIARKETPKEHATAAYCVFGDGTGTKIHDNVFFTNDRAFECIWDAPQNYTFTNNRFYRLTPEDKITTFFFWNAKPVSGFRFVDCTFGPGVGDKSFNFPDTREDWPKDAEFAVGCTMMFKVSADGKPVEGARVTVMSKGRALESPLPHTTDAEGKTAVEVNQFTVLFTAADRKTAVSDRMPLAVKVDGGGAGSYEFEATVEKTSSIDVDLKAKKHTVTPRKDEPAPDLAKIIDEAMKKTGPQAAAN